MLIEGVHEGFFERRSKLKLNKIENFVFGVPTLFNYDGLNKLLYSILEQTLWPREIVICDNGRSIDVDKYKTFPIPVSIIRPSYNKGCGGGWNDIIRYAGNSDVLLASDDTEFIYKDSIEKLYCYTLTEFDCYHFVYGYGYSCFFASRRGINEIGLFDENIWPALYEDTDYSTRVDVLDPTKYSIMLVSIEVCRNYSFTVKNHFATERNVNVRNKNYVFKKWNYSHEIHPINPTCKQPFCNQPFDIVEFEMLNVEKTEISKRIDFTKFKDKIVLVELFDEELILNLKLSNVKGLIIVNDNPKLDKFYVVFKQYTFYFRVFSKFDEFVQYKDYISIDYYIGYNNRNELICDKIIV
jgi:hypothetical protein